MLGLLLLLVGAVSGQDIIGERAGYCGCTSCLEVNNDTYYGVAEDQGGRCWAGQVQGCLMIKGNDEICVCHAPINVNGGTTAFANSCKGCISSAKDFKDELEGILTGGPRRRDVCDGQLMCHMSQSPFSSLSNGNAWAWASGWKVLNHFLDLASNACTRAPPRLLKPKTCKGGQSVRTKLIQDMLHYVGFGDEDINLNSSYVMVVFETAKAQAAWAYDLFQPTWTNVYTYLGQSGGFQICNGSQPIDCTRMHMPEGFMDTLHLMNGSEKNYKAITNCDNGGVTVEDGCNPAYVAMLEEFEPYSYYADCYGCSKNCVKFYNEKFDQQTDKILWTRAFFLSCFDMNPYFTGQGVGYDPVAKNETGPEWWIRGDDGVPLTGDAANSMKAQYITVYEGSP